MATAEEENIEMDNMNEDVDNDQDNENTKLINDEIKLTSTHKKSGARPKTSKTLHSYENPSYMLDDDIPGVDDRPTTLTGREENMDSAWGRIKRKFPYFKPKESIFTARVDEFGRVKVKLARRGSKEHNLFANDNDDELTDDLPSTLKKISVHQQKKLLKRLIEIMKDGVKKTKKMKNS